MNSRVAASCAALFLMLAIVVTALVHPPLFTVTGNLSTPLRPGAGAPLDLTISNTHSFPITVTSVTVSVDAVTNSVTGAPSRCGANNFSVAQSVAVAPLELAPHARASLSSLKVPKAAWPQIRMLKTSGLQDECQSVALTLGYHAATNFWDNIWSHK